MVKNTRQIIARYYSVAVIVLSFVLLAGCGPDSTPEPPLAKNRLLIEAMQNIQQQQHGKALARLEKLKVIYPDDAHLLMLCEVEYDNIFIQKLQGGLDQGNIDTALSIIKRAAKIKPLNAALFHIKQDLWHLKNLQAAMSGLEQSQSSAELYDAIKHAELVIKNYPVAKSFLPLLAKYKKLANLMAKNERKNAQLDLVADLKQEKSRPKPDIELVNVLKAQVAVENKKK